MTTRPFTLGAVAYDPKVVTIWEGFKDWFADHDFAFDYVLYSNYEAQAEAHLAGAVDVTWDSPLAWVRTRRLAAAAGRAAHAVAMRDSDQDLTSVVMVRTDSAIADVDVKIRRFEVGVGLHGDHVGGERDAARALAAGEVDAACMLDGNHLVFTHEGTLPAGGTRVVAQTAPFDHCNMSAVGDHPSLDRFAELLLAMDYADPTARPLMDLEGLTRWLSGRETGYGALEAAVDRVGFYDAKGQITADGYRP